MFKKINYPVEWPEIKERILRRDNHCCQVCGLRNFSVGERKEDGTFVLWQETDSYAAGKQLAREVTAQTGRKHSVIVLAIAHLHDMNPLACDDGNLGSQCQYHHTQRDKYHHSVNARQTRERQREARVSSLPRSVVVPMYDDDEWPF